MLPVYCLKQVLQVKTLAIFFEAQFKFCDLMEYMHSVDDDLDWCALVTCLQTSDLGLLQGPQKPSSVLSGGTLALTSVF